MRAPLILAPLNLIQKLEESISTSFMKIIENQKQTETLKQLRDTLLPQLISGKVRVPERMVEKMTKVESKK
jgi:type I restriction enzyme S subunit